MRVGVLEFLTPAELQKKLKADPETPIGVEVNSLRDDITSIEAIAQNDANAVLAALKYDLLALFGKAPQIPGQDAIVPPEVPPLDPVPEEPREVPLPRGGQLGK